MITTEKTPGRDFTVLNLSDIQLTTREWESETGEHLVRTVRHLMEKVKPDLVTLCGDIAWSNHPAVYGHVADLLDGYGVPFAPLFGNHDHQDGPGVASRLADILCERKTCLFERGDPELGLGNYVILVAEGGRPVHGIIMTDSHEEMDYTAPDGTVSREYAELSREQIAWYREQIGILNGMGVPETTVMMHIPNYAFRLAADAAFRKDIDRMGMDPRNARDCWNEGYEDSFGAMYEEVSSYPVDNGFLDAVLEGGSTKTVICAHNHIINFSVPYRGIRFVFSLKTGRGCYCDSRLNGGTVIKIGPDGRATVTHEYVD